MTEAIECLDCYFCISIQTINMITMSLVGVNRNPGPKKISRPLSGVVNFFFWALCFGFYQAARPITVSVSLLIT